MRWRRSRTLTDLRQICEQRANFTAGARSRSLAGTLLKLRRREISIGEVLPSRSNAVERSVSPTRTLGASCDSAISSSLLSFLTAYLAEQSRMRP